MRPGTPARKCLHFPVEQALSSAVCCAGPESKVPDADQHELRRSRWLGEHLQCIGPGRLCEPAVFACKVLSFPVEYTQLRACLATQVDPRHFHTLGHWSREKTMETILIDLRKEMQQSHNRKLPQPPEGTRYSS